MIHVHTFALICASLCSAVSVSDSLEVSVTSRVSQHSGHTTTLPCWLSPAQSAENLEVRWYRSGHFDSPILLYQGKKYGTAQVGRYFGRVSFGLKDTASGGLSVGDVSLKLLNVTSEDAGDYICYVSSDRGHDQASVNLSVFETGTTPLLSVEWSEENSMNVSCESEGWYPQPTLRWSDHEQDLIPKHLEYSRTPSGHVLVHSWLLVSDFPEVTCSVSLSHQYMKEARVRFGNIPQPANQRATVAGWVLFALLLITVLMFLGAWCYRKKAFGKKDKSERGQVEEMETFLQNALDEAKTYYENVILKETGNKYIAIKDNKLRDAKRPEGSDGEEVTCRTAARGTTGFSSGQHYWEVSLWRLGGEECIKKSWWLGVTNVPDCNSECSVPPTPSNGFWFLSSSPDKADSFQFNTEPVVSLPVQKRPRTVGVYLSYDSGELTFYNADNGCVIASLAAQYTGEVFPFFNPGKDDIVPMEILLKTEQGESSDMGNCVDVKVQGPES